MELVMIENTIQPSPMIQTVPRRQGISAGMTVALVLLALLVILTGIGFLFYATLFRVVSYRMQATAVVQNILTAQAQATIIASPQYVYSQVTKRTPSYTDPLDGQHISFWAPRQQGNSTCNFANDGYHIRIAPGDSFITCLTMNSYRNFLFQVQMTIKKGSESGIMFRSSEQRNEEYVFGITDNGLYSVDVATGPQGGTILVYGRSAFINSGLNQPNLLSVLAQGSTFSFYINKHFVKSIHNNLYADGSIGFAAVNFLHINTDCVFTNVKVWTL